MHRYRIPGMRRRMRRRSRGLGNVIQSFKMVVNDPATSRAAATTHQTLISTGVDSAAAGQTGPTSVNVPTGAVIKQIEIQYAASNLVSVASFLNACVLLLRTGQTNPSPLTIGGDARRNQVFHQDMFSLGKDQNVNRKYIIKIPPKFQRVREGDTWKLLRNGTSIFTDQVQIIYKFYR